MNAAARALAQGNVFKGEYRQMPITRELIGLIFLIVLVLSSALAVVYLKNSERNYFSDLQAQRNEASRLEVEWGQLLLEQSTWATPSRVQAIAQEKLGMILPDQHKVRIIRY